MSMMEATKETRDEDTTGARFSSENLERRSRWNWLLLASTLVITTLGLGTVITTLLSHRFVSPWPWVNTDFGLVVAFVLLILAFLAYSTHEQRQLAVMKSGLQDFQEEMEEHYRRRLYALFDVSRTMGLKTRPQSVFDCITKACVETFECGQASLMLFDKETQTLEVRSASGHSDIKKVLGSRQKIGEGVAGWAAKHRKALLLGRENELKEDHDLKLKSTSISAAMVVPIILRDELVGVVNVSSHSPDVDYDAEDLRALRVFAENAGTCIRHAEQAQWMRQTIDNLQTKLARVSDSIQLPG
jgi:transcriptional regulator with GAF, ATPase, and Fis domain